MEEKKGIAKYREFIVYIIFGVLTTLVSWGSYALFVNICHLSVAVSNFLSWICGVIFAFITNKIFVFESKSWKLSLVIKEAGTFVAARLLTGVIEWFGVPLLARAGFDNIFYATAKSLGIGLKIIYTDGIYSKILVSVIVVLLNYIFSKLIIFRKRDDKIDKSNS